MKVPRGKSSPAGGEIPTKVLPGERERVLFILQSEAKGTIRITAHPEGRLTIDPEEGIPTKVHRDALRKITGNVKIRTRALQGESQEDSLTQTKVLLGSVKTIHDKEGNERIRVLIRVPQDVLPKSPITIGCE